MIGDKVDKKGLDEYADRLTAHGCVYLGFCKQPKMAWQPVPPQFLCRNKETFRFLCMDTREWHMIC